MESERKVNEDALPEHLFPERCGLRKDDQFVDNDDIHFRVIQGSVAKKGDYPWQVRSINFHLKDLQSVTKWIKI